ncbi:unnamed protein product [Fusarium graminearum]|uniref:Chromosome 1, complete genome n=1 Tax=Gibberella zeae (strain ATCC MYA-4620 / CBS 123657 / FGSC 9075 / NRRL 31084 / PH-1) TaxID=229533 RepID=A0A0E0RTZ7_GIBZE|nr:hypothetical protein FG05_02430 [Fusarium graminearum]KAI6749975.1 hypothetical protein HG531_007240 [Fusarium graminearum]CEF74722.1 unnamed protein product [Fusarium graminearum]
MAKPTLHESDGLLNPNNNMDRSVDNDSKESTKKMDDWKVSLISGSCACTAVFIINLGLTIWSGVSLKDAADSTETSRRIMYEGTCSTTRNINLVIHLIINVFGSILLSASNYGMQCLSTPTRADVDRAHAQGKWVDIGIPSFRNLWKVSLWRVVLWWLLVLSSIPLHLLLNSVVYSSLSSYSYEVFGADRNLYLIEKDSDLPARKSTLATFKSRNMLVSQLDNLTASECINEYGTTFQTKRADVILVFDFSMSKEESNQTYEINSALSHNVRRGDCIETDYDWICANESCDTPCHFLLPEIKRQPDNWKPYRLYDNKVKYCLSQPAPQRCRLNFDITLASIVLVVNFVKAIILAFIAFRPPKEPLFVLGDAIQSFMTRPEENPRGSCLISAHSVRNDLLDEPGLVHTAPKRRGAAISYTRWFFSLAMYGVTLGVSCWLLYYGISQISDRHDFKSLWGLGFGTANELTLITGWGFSNGLQHEQNIFRQVLVSNIPQFIFSMLYFHYNSLYTAMAAAKEWSDFGHKRRPLRVSSSPRGQQRSRYFLQLPYRYSIPLILVSILVHWMLSQCIFVVIVESYIKIRTEFQYQGTVVTCGYSPIAIICVIITSGLMAVAVFTTALRRLPTGMPVAASCSVAIAPACRQPDGFSHPEEAPLLPLQWGVMTIEREGSDREITDHCGFSHESVEKPEDGHAYY